MGRFFAALLTAALSAPAVAGEVPDLLVPPSLGRPDVVWIAGRVLEEEQGKHGPKFFRNARALTNENLVGARVEVRFLGRTATAVSGHDGEFEVEIAAASGAPFAYVSGSPVQLAPRVGRFLEVNGFPPAGLYLRNLGPKSLSGYKEPVLRTLAARFPQPLVLVGDSGEKDPEIYAALAKELPGRVKRIYVRRAGPKGKASRYDGELLFEDPSDALRDAAGLGLVAAECR